MKAVLRRADGGPAPEVVQAGAVTIDTGRREVRIDDVPVEFTTKEFDLLRFLAERPGLALSRQQILDGVWGYDWFGDARTVDVHIAQVRKKLGDAVDDHDGARRRLPARTAEAAPRRDHAPSDELVVSGPRRRLRTRLLVAMVAIALGTLVLTALVTAGLARETAVDAARDDLRDHGRDHRRRSSTGSSPSCRPARRHRRRSSGVGRSSASATWSPPRSAVSDGAVFGISADGDPREVLGMLLGIDSGASITLPNDVDVHDLDLASLRTGETQNGRAGDTVFTALPLTPVGETAPVLVLAEQVNTRPFGDAGGAVLGAALLALVVAVAVAAYLARRLTRPLAAMETTARSIASGDLAARVDETHVRDDELGSLAHAINGMAQELEDAQGHERAFLLSVSHDLRTPLTSIRGYAEAIADGTVEGRRQPHPGRGR